MRPARPSAILDLMPRRKAIDHLGLESLLARDEGVATRKELERLGMPGSTISYRSRAGGPWQRPLPGVVVAQSGPLTSRQRILCAVKYAGRGATVSGPTALVEAGFRSPARSGNILVLVVGDRRRQSSGFVDIERTTIDPDAHTVAGVRYAHVARAVIDTCRRSRELNQVRGLIAEAVQRRHVSLSALAAEIRSCAARGSALPRRVMREVRAGVRSVAEAQARKIIIRSGLPQPRWNVALSDRHGARLGVVDAFWVAFGVVLEIDSMEWHLSPADYRRTQRRQARLGRHGLRVIPVAPGDVGDDPALLVETIRDTLAASTGPAPHVRIVESPSQAA